MVSVEGGFRDGSFLEKSEVVTRNVGSNLLREPEQEIQTM